MNVSNNSVDIDLKVVNNKECDSLSKSVNATISKLANILRFNSSWIKEDSEIEAEVQNLRVFASEAIREIENVVSKNLPKRQGHYCKKSSDSLYRCSVTYTSNGLFVHVPNSRIAKGGEASIKLAIDLSTKQLVALSKRRIKTKQKSNDELVHERIGQSKSVVSALALINYPRSTFDDNALKFMNLYINGDVGCVLHDMNSIPDGKLLIKWALSAAKGVQAFHHQNLIHNDIKPANLMVDHDGTTLLLGDFGLIEDCSIQRFFSEIGRGTIMTVAPEKVKVPSLDNESYKMTDIYSLGATFCFLAYRLYLPWQIKGSQISDLRVLTQEKVNKFFDQKIPKYTDIFSFEYLFWQMLYINPKLRPKIDEVVERITVMSQFEERVKRVEKLP